MDWPYHLVDLSPEQRHERRIILDRYGVYAQLSALVPILAYQLYRLATWVYAARQRQKDAQYNAVPSSPRLKHAKLARTYSLISALRRVRWWMQDEVAEGWGERGHWIAGGAWMSWLMFLCVHNTGDDYLHITKRFGVIATSQLPLHYMLSMKSLYSPLAVLFQTSHEHLNSYHRVSGRLIYTLLILHGTWYMNFFVQAGLLEKRLTSIVVWIGIIALLAMSLLMSTSLEKVRRWSYRVFFAIHLLVGIAILPLLFFHASPLRLYVSEALFLFIFDIACRKLDTVVAFPTITSVPGTSLIKLDIPISPRKIQRFKGSPGQHVYLQIPPESVPTSSSSPYLYELLYNPFTVAAVSDTHISLVLRVLDGPATQALAQLSRMNKAHPPLNIEGPLGSSRHFPNFAVEYDRVLLVAGGVGATFVVPFYREIQTQLLREARSTERVKMIWSMRDIAESQWASDADTSSAKENVELYVTDSRSQTSSQTVDGSVELVDVASSADAQNASGGKVVTHRKGRPDLRRAVDELFRHGVTERVAVLVCGPDGMAREARGYIGKWVESGREVWFHDESFGW